MRKIIRIFKINKELKRRNDLLVKELKIVSLMFRETAELSKKRLERIDQLEDICDHLEIQMCIYKEKYITLINNLKK